MTHEQSQGDARDAFMHPLAQGDVGLIQDFFLTKIALLCAQSADLNEWAFEMRALEDLTPERERPVNAFLFAHTLARYWSALVDSNQTAPLDGASFASRFVAAVAAADGRAREVWFAELDDEPGLTGAQVWNFTAELVVDAGSDRLVGRTPFPLSPAYVEPTTAES